MNSTETTPARAPAGDRQIGQLLGGRYRLAMSKGGDDVADVWHALDESTQTVVTLEILRDRGNESARQRFLAEARRMAAIERPSVMRVASILDEGTETFIVFEHLIPLPVVLTGLTAVARDVRPATKAAEDKDRTVVLAPAAPQAPAPLAPATLTAVAGPTRTAAEDVLADETAAAIVELDDTRGPSVPQLVAAATRLPETVASATRSLMSARTGMSRVVPLATGLLADLRRFVGDVMRDAQLDTLIADARARLAITGPALSNVTTLGARIVSSAGPLVTRARANPVVSAAAIGVLVLVAFIVSPLDDAIASALRGGPAPSPTVAPRAALVPAGFVVPPLSAYGATFESQGPYPTTTPNGTVEWVVALRNTGSAGWYRGIEGAQAALMTPDGAGVAVQSTDYVAPGQVGWFVVRFKARAEVGAYTVQLLPRIDGRGPMPELGIFTVVTVAKNP